MGLCIECKKRPIKIKKRKLCSICYGKLYRQKRLAKINPSETMTIKEYKNSGEVLFIKNYFSHKNWEYQPAIFYMGNERYRPNFYDGETNTFIEVSGTRQAYHFNKYKYDLFRSTYPKINFEVRTPDGNLLKEDSNGRLVWDKK